MSPQKDSSLHIKSACLQSLSGLLHFGVMARCQQPALDTATASALCLVQQSRLEAAIPPHSCTATSTLYCVAANHSDQSGKFLPAMLRLLETQLPVDKPAESMPRPVMHAQVMTKYQSSCHMNCCTLLEPGPENKQAQIYEGLQ